MASVTKYTGSGKKSGTATLDDHTFGIEPNVSVMHQVVTNQLATRRAGTQSTKTRSEVRGGGAKPYRQKGTGNARQGTIRAPHYVGGGVALGPKPRSYAKKTPKKMINLALRSALSDRAADDKVIVIDAWSFDAPSTKSAAELLAALGVDGSVLVVAGREHANVALSMRNLPDVQVCEPRELNAYDVLANRYIVFAESDLPSFAGPSSPSGAAKQAAADTSAAKSTGKSKTKAPKQSAAAAAPDAPPAAADVDDAQPAVQPLADTGAFAPGEWAGSVLPDADGNGPESHPIKGNASSKLYHVPGSAFYKRTKAEVWFDTEDSAQAAGFDLPPSQRDESDNS